MPNHACKKLVDQSAAPKDGFYFFRNYLAFRECVVNFAHTKCNNQDQDNVILYLIEKGSHLSWRCSNVSLNKPLSENEGKPGRGNLFSYSQVEGREKSTYEERMHVLRGDSVPNYSHCLCIEQLLSTPPINTIITLANAAVLTTSNMIDLACSRTRTRMQTTTIKVVYYFPANSSRWIIFTLARLMHNPCRSASA